MKREYLWTKFIRNRHPNCLKKGRRYVDQRPGVITCAHDAQLFAAALPGALASACNGSDSCHSTFGGCMPARTVESRNIQQSSRLTGTCQKIACRKNSD